jgi:propanol-preferring alcohol dehydrogenase
LPDPGARAAAEIPIRPTTTEHPFEKAAVALEDLARDAVNGAAVIRVAGDG